MKLSDNKELKITCTLLQRLLRDSSIIMLICISSGFFFILFLPADCPKPENVTLIAVVVCLAVITIGIILAVVWKLFICVHDQKEVAKFEAERAKAKWQSVGNFSSKKIVKCFYVIIYSSPFAVFSFAGHKSSFQKLNINI